MAITKRLRKGGEARYSIFGATQNDFFTVPRGFYIRNLFVENSAYESGTGLVPEFSSTQTSGGTTGISLGKTPGVLATATFTVAATSTTAGTLTVAGVPMTIVAGLTTAGVVAVITSPAYTQQLLNNGWTINPNTSPVTGVVNFIGTVPVPLNTTFPTTTLSITISASTYTAGSSDATYMPVTYTSTPVVGSITEMTSAINAAYRQNSSFSGNILSVTFTSTTGAAGTYTLPSPTGTYLASTTVGGGAGTLTGFSVSIPNSFTAIMTGTQMAGVSQYVFTISSAAGSGTIFLNGVSMTSSATPSTLATTIAALQIPNWMCMASSATVTMVATVSGALPQPVFTLGTAASLPVLTAATYYPGFTIPGFILQNTTPITETVTYTTTATTAAVYNINGINVTVPVVTFGTGTTVAQAAQIMAGYAVWYAPITATATGTGWIITAQGASSSIAFNATLATSMTALGSALVPGWTVAANVATGQFTLIANTPGPQAAPFFVMAAGVAAPTVTPVYYQGFTIPGYTIGFTGTTTTFAGPSPVFTTVTAATGMTTAIGYSYGGSTGSFTIQSVSGFGLPAPSNNVPFISGAITTQTYTQTSLAADLPYYLNFTNPAVMGNVNVYALMAKMN
jgi:hypothetical protein